MIGLRNRERAPAAPPPAPPLPRSPAPALPMHSAPARTVLTTHQGFAEEAARAAQRYLDQVHQIEELIDDRDQWRNRALLAEGEIKRLEKREGDLIRQIDERSDQVTTERDAYKRTLTEVSANYNAASKILLDGFAAIRALEDRINGVPAPPATAKTEAASREPAKPADLHDEIPVETMPSVVRAGPRDFDREEHDARS